MSCRSTTIPRNQFSAATPTASAKSTTATIHATGLRTVTGPHPLSTAAARDSCYPKYVRDIRNVTNG
ncbi:hypothetical protein GCM10023323_51520 [Streptomyces thinghirensis]|uniref:Uncharacterized protein n=1 Tax=Streptomyces thinghirensis TaxID=551547 RepID=A0ABP9TB57_9ACTN